MNRRTIAAIVIGALLVIPVVLLLIIKGPPSLPKFFRKRNQSVEVERRRDRDRTGVREVGEPSPPPETQEGFRFEPDRTYYYHRDALRQWVEQTRF